MRASGLYHMLIGAVLGAVAVYGVGEAMGPASYAECAAERSRGALTKTEAMLQVHYCRKLFPK